MPPAISHILSRTFAVIVFLVLLLYGFRHVNKHQRKSAAASELAKICGESSFFRQFTAEDARKTLVRAMGLLAEAESLGVNVDDAIKQALGIKSGLFDEEIKPDDIPMRQKIIQSSLRGNYDNFIKLGFKAEFDVFHAMKEGNLPAIPSGPFSGKKPIIRTLIPEQASPGMEKVIANLELAPPGTGTQPLTDIQLAAAKQLARDLYHAQLIEEPVTDRIIAYLSGPEEPGKK